MSEHPPLIAPPPFSMTYDPADPFDEKFRNGTFAHCLTFFLRKILVSGDIFVDAGAQKGFVTLHAATLVGKDGRGTTGDTRLTEQKARGS